MTYSLFARKIHFIRHNNLENKWKWIHPYYCACHISACEICNRRFHQSVF